MCTKCSIQKEPSEYYFLRKKDNVRSTVCKECSKVYNENRKIKYRLEPNKYIEATKQRTVKLLTENRVKLLDYLHKHPCLECGESNPVTLQFNHREPEKKEYNVSEKINRYNWDRLMLEIQKCDVLCANCHHKHTAKQFGWWNNNIAEWSRGSSLGS